MTFENWSNTQLLDAIDLLMARAGRDEVLRSELDAQLADIYDVLSDPDLRDYVGAIDVAINQHIALTDSMQSRAELLDALIAECGKRMAMAMAASRTFVGPSYRYRKDDSYTNCLISAHGGAKIKRERSPTFLIYQGRLARVAFFI